MPKRPELGRLGLAVMKENVSGSADVDRRARRVIRHSVPAEEPVSVNPSYGGASLGDVARALMRPRSPAARATLERLQADGS